MNKAVLTLVAGLSFTALATSAQAAGDAAAGETKAAACISCHGAQGAAPIMPEYPKLNGQNAAYLEVALKGFRDGSRSGGQSAAMAPLAQGLSDQDIADLAAYFASVK